MTASKYDTNIYMISIYYNILYYLFQQRNEEDRLASVYIVYRLCPIYLECLRMPTRFFRLHCFKLEKIFLSKAP